MLKTNTKKARENIRNYIMENCDPTNFIGYTIEAAPQTWEEVRDFIISTFTNEKLKHDLQYKAGRVSKREMFFDWCQGLPSALDTCYYYNRSAVDDLGAILEETEVEKAKFTESQAEEKLTHLIFLELFK